MPDPLFDSDDDANTPITAEEREGLIPSYITLRHELNEAEQVNIGVAQGWANGRRRDILDRDFPKELHQRDVRRRMALGGAISYNGPQYLRRSPSDRQ